MRITHSKVGTWAHNPAREVSRDDWNDDHEQTVIPVFDPADYGAVDVTGAVDSSTAIRSAASAAEAAGGGIVRLPATPPLGALLVSGNPALHLLSGVRYLGAGMERPVGAFTTPSPVYGTRIKYLGGDACFASPSTATRRYAPGVKGVTVYTIGATSGHRAIEIQNMEGGMFDDMLLNGYWSTNGTGIKIAGNPPTSATSANRFRNIVVAANVIGVELLAQANFNKFTDCHFFGSGIAISSVPTSDYNDTNIFLDIYIATSNDTIVQLGGGAGATRSFQFINLRVERIGGSGAQDFIFGTNAQWHTVLGGSMVPTPSTYGNVDFIGATAPGAAGSTNALILPSQGHILLPADVTNTLRLNKGLTGAGVLDFPSIAAGATAELNVSVPGAVTGDIVMLGPPPNILPGLVISGYVPSANLVTVRLHNSTGAAINPGAFDVWKAAVMRQ